jgi:hypothetical protein
MTEHDQHDEQQHDALIPATELLAEQAGGHDSGEPTRHAAPDGAKVHPLIDLTRDPTPGKPDHAVPDED